jgi:hypothetical protein
VDPLVRPTEIQQKRACLQIAAQSQTEGSEVALGMAETASRQEVDFEQDYLYI